MPRDTELPYTFVRTDPGHHDLTLRATPLMLALLLLLSFLGLNRGLWTPDEPREAEVSREMMLAPGVIPTLNGAQFIEKPPLYYWTVAGAYRLAGAPSAATARAVSSIAGFLTLLVVFLWGRRADCTTVGLVASCMLATSLQFVITAHWILIDPMLMLFTTTAAWAAWELLRGAGGALAVGSLYLSLALALWTKGLIGPVLIGAGLAAYSAIERRWPGRVLHLGIGLASMATAFAILAAAIYASGGTHALWEWIWVNHVLRFLHPLHTGHDAPFHYYLWTLPFAMLPWLAPAADAMRPRRWHQGGAALRRYCITVAIAMVAVLSASATKRGIYLMPVLPILFLGLATGVRDWLEEHTPGTGLGLGWLAQATLAGMFALAPPVAALVYLHRPDWMAVAFLAVSASACIMLVMAYQRRDAKLGLASVVCTALVGAAAVLVLAPHAVDAEKNMAPFLKTVDRQLPPGERVAAFGTDETLAAIVPFVTGRGVDPIDAAELEAIRSGAAPPPPYLLVQTKVKNVNPPDLGKGYVLVESRYFGPGRNIALWKLKPD